MISFVYVIHTQRDLNIYAVLCKYICTTTHSDKTAGKTEMVALLFKCRFESGAKSHLEVFLQGVLMTPEMTMIRH